MGEIRSPTGIWIAAIKIKVAPARITVAPSRITHRRPDMKQTTLNKFIDRSSSESDPADEEYVEEGPALK